MTATLPNAVEGEAAGAARMGLDGDMSDTERTKPEVEFPEGPAPTTLEIKDQFEGDGDVAQAGSTVDVHYLGVEYDSGEEFDSSWSRGQSIRFPLQQLIRGWQQGIPGMRVGGRRTLTVPPELAYGPEGGGHPLSGKTLVFVIDLLGVA
jgi:peptidylprolyl isomerase